jgi:hypothetical protein
MKKSITCNVYASYNFANTSFGKSLPILFYFYPHFKMSNDCHVTKSRRPIKKLKTDLVLLKLLYKLHQHGFQDNTLQLVKSFLIHIARRHLVVVDGEMSDL